MRNIFSPGLAVPFILAGSLLTPTTMAGELRFEPVAAPATDEDKRRVVASQRLKVAGQDHPIGFHPILRSGDAVGGGTYGLLTDHAGKPLTNDDGSPRISQRNDFASLIPVGRKLFMISQFEDIPGAVYLTELDQDRQTGTLMPLATRPIDLSGVHGGWLHCAGSVTPWNSHLGSEEYEPDARGAADGAPDAKGIAMAASLGADPWDVNPYDSGWPVEVKVLDEAGRTEVTKHYALGRRSLELAYVMPDRRTVYLTDDGTNVGLHMFVADAPGDLSAGQLYAARWIQNDRPFVIRWHLQPDGGYKARFEPGKIGRDGGAGALQWVDLGHASADEIGAQIRDGIGFEDIFDAVVPVDGVCPDGFRSVNSGHSRPFHECLKLHEGMDKAASRLESRRYAAFKGATTEWRKMEGITFDPDGMRLFVAMSEVSAGMEDFRRRGKPDDTYDQGGPNHIRLPYNLCGVVYALDVTGGVRDTSGKPIPSDLVAVNMVSEIAGRMTRAWDPESDLPAYAEDGPFAANECDLKGIANPDNLTFIPGYSTLIIGEDTGSGHQNDAIWAYDVGGHTLTRIQTTPYGAETTSPYFYPNIDGFGYLMSVVQHPYGESDQDKLVPGSGAERAYTGYIGPFPAMGR
jgi:secreted PhoX family phosphatase